MNSARNIDAWNYFILVYDCNLNGIVQNLLSFLVLGKTLLGKDFSKHDIPPWGVSESETGTN